MTSPGSRLAIIVFSVFACTSPWFASNAIVDDLRIFLDHGDAAVAHLTSAVQLGFITGTLAFAVLTVVDRFCARHVFFACALLGAASNLLVLIMPRDYPNLVVWRFATGFFLAGIYPVGMKIAAQWYTRDLGHAIGALAAAVVVGTAFPHLLKGFALGLEWRQILVSVSLLAVLGGFVMLIGVPEGPHLPRGEQFHASAVFTVFRSREFRASALGYFGHMWELYTLWALIPLILAGYAQQTANFTLDASLWSFVIIAVGAAGCAGGGMASRRAGSAPVAAAQLGASMLCCLAYPVMAHTPPWLFLAFMCFWGIVVVGDSPQLSTLNARAAPPALVGSALTLVVCIGFSLTIASIQFTLLVARAHGLSTAVLLLGVGPLLGLLAMRPLLGACRA